MRKYLAPLGLVLVGFMFGGPFGSIVLLLIWAVFMSVHATSTKRK